MRDFPVQTGKRSPRLCAAQRPYRLPGSPHPQTPAEDRRPDGWACKHRRGGSPRCKDSGDRGSKAEKGEAGGLYEHSMRVLQLSRPWPRRFVARCQRSRERSVPGGGLATVSWSGGLLKLANPPALCSPFLHDGISGKGFEPFERGGKARQGLASA